MKRDEEANCARSIEAVRQASDDLQYGFHRVANNMGPILRSLAELEAESVSAGLLSAVKQCIDDLRRRRFLASSDSRVASAIASAVEKFAFEAGVFSTGLIQDQFRADDGWMPSGGNVAELLAKHRSVVRLAGGCHWYFLPAGLLRYEGE
jgi:hypothetical protein